MTKNTYVGASLDPNVHMRCQQAPVCKDEYFDQAQTCYTWATGVDKGFPINVRKAFPLVTWGRILDVVLVHHKSLSDSYKYLFFSHQVCN